MKKRKFYRTAADYLKKAKYIYKNILKDKAGWNQRFTKLKREFKNRPAFLEEVSRL